MRLRREPGTASSGVAVVVTPHIMTRKTNGQPSNFVWHPYESEVPSALRKDPGSRWWPLWRLASVLRSTTVFTFVNACSWPSFPERRSDRARERPQHGRR
jgi:hypothetical protein